MRGGRRQSRAFQCNRHIYIARASQWKLKLRHTGMRNVTHIFFFRMWSTNLQIGGKIEGKSKRSLWSGVCFMSSCSDTVTACLSEGRAQALLLSWAIWYLEALPNKRRRADIVFITHATHYLNPCICFASGEEGRRMIERTSWNMLELHNSQFDCTCREGQASAVLPKGSCSLSFAREAPWFWPLPHHPSHTA